MKKYWFFVIIASCTALFIQREAIFSALNLDQKAQEGDGIKLIWKAMTKVDQMYRNPKAIHLCGELENVVSKDSIPRLACDRNYLDCVVKKYNQMGSSVSAKLLKSSVNPIVLLRYKDIERKYELKENCHEITLADGQYFTKTRFNKIYWDTSGRKFSVDRYQVTRNQYMVGEIDPDSPYFTPMTGLSKVEMRAYCFSKGKTVAQTHIIDALSYKKDPKKERESFYHFSFSKKKSSFYLKEKGYDREDCFYLYAKECLKITPYQGHKLVSSEKGLSEVLGGYPEYIENLFSPSENLRISSFYLPIHSKLHQLGVRVNWDGVGFDRKNLKYFLNEPKENILYPIKIGFRCMRQW